MPAAQSAEPNPAAATPSASERLVDQLANRIGGLGVELADVAGNLQEVASRVSGQSDRFGQLQKAAETMVSANHGIADASQAVQAAGPGHPGLDLIEKLRGQGIGRHNFLPVPCRTGQMRQTFLLGSRCVGVVS